MVILVRLGWLVWHVLEWLQRRSLASEEITGLIRLAHFLRRGGCGRGGPRAPGPEFARRSAPTKWDAEENDHGAASTKKRIQARADSLEVIATVGGIGGPAGQKRKVLPQCFL